MREIIGGRTITAPISRPRRPSTATSSGYRIDVDWLDAVTHLSSLRSSPNVDARVMASAIDTELLLGYEGERRVRLLRDSGIRAWRDQDRLLEQVLDRLRDEMKGSSSWSR